MPCSVFLNLLMGHDHKRIAKNCSNFLNKRITGRDAEYSFFRSIFSLKHLREREDFFKKKFARGLEYFVVRSRCCYSPMNLLKDLVDNLTEITERIRDYVL